MNQYFCLLKPTRSGMHGNLRPGEAEVFGRHCEYLEEQFRGDRVHQAGTSFEKGSPDGFAIVILSAETKDEAVAMMQADPAVQHGLLQATVTEYQAFLDRANALPG